METRRDVTFCNDRSGSWHQYARLGEPRDAGLESTLCSQSFSQHRNGCRITGNGVIRDEKGLGALWKICMCCDSFPECWIAAYTVTVQGSSSSLTTDS